MWRCDRCGVDAALVCDGPPPLLPYAAGGTVVLVAVADETATQPVTEVGDPTCAADISQSAVSLWMSAVPGACVAVGTGAVDVGVTEVAAAPAKWQPCPAAWRSVSRWR